MGGHEIVRRRVLMRGPGSAWGVVNCTCGWDATIGPFGKLAEADDAVVDRWLAHLEESES